MKNVQCGKSATRNECNTKKCNMMWMQHGATREKVQQEKGATHKKVQHEHGMTQKKCNLKRVQYEKVQHG